MMLTLGNALDHRLILSYLVELNTEDTFPIWHYLTLVTDSTKTTCILDAYRSKVQSVECSNRRSDKSFELTMFSNIYFSGFSSKSEKVKKLVDDTILGGSNSE